MKRTLSIAIVCLLLLFGLWGAATYWFGVKTEAQYRALLQQAAEYPNVKLVNESYVRGFLSSKAQTAIEVQPAPDAAAEKQPIRLLLAHDIFHGPFPLAKPPGTKPQFKPVMGIIETSIVFSPENQNQISSVYAQIPEIASARDYTIIDLDGNGEEQLHIPAFQHTFGDEDKVAVDWKGLSLQTSFTIDMKAFSGLLKAPGLEVTGKDFDLRIKEAASTLHVREDASGLSLGEASFDLDAVEYSEKNGTEPVGFLMQGFRANTSSKASGDNVSFLGAIRTDQVKLNRAQYGPGVFEMEFRNLDAASLLKLQEAARQQASAPAKPSTEAEQLVMLGRYMEILPGLLKKSPEFEVKQLEIKTTDGDFTGKARLAFDGTKLESTQDLLALANALAAQAEFKVAESLLRRVAIDTMKADIVTEYEEQKGVVPDDKEIQKIASARLDEQLKALMAQNMILKENGNYVARGSYEGGQIILNGRPLSLQNLMQ